MRDRASEYLYGELERELGRKFLRELELPSYFRTSLNPSFKLRPYQVECFQYFRALLHEDFQSVLKGRRHFLFHMATGSGKTLIMAGILMMLYEQGYRNVLFFVDQKPIIAKTKINFLSPKASKYLFNTPIQIGDKQIEIREVSNFQESHPDCLNICFSTLAQLHLDLNQPKENAPTYEDFEDLKLVMIADEAHHINADTKKGVSKARDLFGNIGGESESWEDTVMRIHNISDSLLLEFTATMPLSNEYIRDKYRDKLLYDYPLRRFREDKYSKDIEVVQRDLDELGRALQAIVLSQYKRKLFNAIGQPIKPVVFFKSKTKKANKEFIESFSTMLKELQPGEITEIEQGSVGDVRKAFDYFAETGVTHYHLIQELREDFSSEKLVLIDGNNDSDEKQVLLNTLEDSDNEIRAVFAVDMLKEGWDVLNLYDIVRLYDTRDAKQGVPGRTTVSEAQLIGRGARYMPFTAPEGDLPKGQRKYDGDIENPLRVVEKLHYHSMQNPRYIQELKVALVESGIIANTTKEVELRLKEDFKKSSLYQRGYVFRNERQVEESHQSVADLFHSAISSQMIEVSLYTGQMSSELIMSENEDQNNRSGGSPSTSFQATFEALGSSVVRSALYVLSEYTFPNLRKRFPQLSSVSEFVTGDSYISELPIRITGNAPSLTALSQEDKRRVAIQALQTLLPALEEETTAYRGSREFSPVDFQKVFKDHVLKISIEGGEDKEYGQSIRPDLDVSQLKWHAYDDCIGTSEEKALVKYVHSIYAELEERYDEVYLVRNERDLRIYAFDDGQAFEPDYLLFMSKRGEEKITSYYQIFIEPKGTHLTSKDAWKERLLMKLGESVEVTFSQKGKEFVIWGLPFYTQEEEGSFDKSLRDKVGLPR